MINNLNIILLTIISMLLMIIILIVNGKVEDIKKNQVYVACMVATSENNGTTEDLCGEMQPKYGYEFMSDGKGNFWAERNRDVTKSGAKKCPKNMLESEDGTCVNENFYK